MSLSESDGLVTLAIEDDGLGFDPEQEFPGHLGLRSMRERCQQAGGSLTIESRPGQGSRVKAQVPLPGA
jgi:signal transduction histidine kinase